MPIPGHDYDQPTDQSLSAALTASVGADAAQTLIGLASRQLGRRGPAGPDELIRMTEYFMDLGDLLRVTARSQKIRAITYRALHAVD